MMFRKVILLGEGFLRGRTTVSPCIYADPQYLADNKCYISEKKAFAELPKKKRAQRKKGHGVADS